jgi:hypothetical protein
MQGASHSAGRGSQPQSQPVWRTKEGARSEHDKCCHTIEEFWIARKTSPRLHQLAFFINQIGFFG